MEPSIVPPPDVRAIIDKTIPVLRQSDESTPQRLLLTKPKLFGFLNPADPYHAWYQWRLETPAEEPATAAEPEKGEIVAIEPLRFSVLQPPLSSGSLQIIKLTAFYTAADPEFPNSLPADGQFAFLSSNHSLHSLYSDFVDQYKLLQAPPADVVARLESIDVLERAVARAKYMQQVGKQAEKEIEEAKKDQIEFSQIDWQDFVVVETVLFVDGEHIDQRPLRKEDVEVKRLLPEKQANQLKLRSPYTGELIPADQFDEHMRIMNLDPTWRQQRDVAQQRQATTNLYMSHAAANLKRMMAAKNGDGPSKKRR